ncbi:MAG: glycosyltransferase family 39 protein [Chloroflexi bacterium]|nr:glycosyltransferase family 39 protein [Chloroflexota bacterium]
MKPWRTGRALLALVLAIILLVSFGLRLWGIVWSLPYVDHPDEGVIVDHAIRFLKTGNLDPAFFNWPSLCMYFTAGVYWLHFLVEWLQGLQTTPSQLPDSTFIFTAAPDLYIWGRATTAVLGTALVAVTYLIGSRHFGKNVGLIAAGLAAVSPLLIENSHYITPDIPVALLVALALMLALEGLRAGTNAPLLWSGLFVGLAASAKYNGIVVGVAIVVVWLLRAIPAGTGLRILALVRSFSLRALRTPSIVAVPVLAVAGFLAFTPFAVLDWPKFSHDMLFHIGIYEGERYLPMADVPIWLNYLVSLFGRGEWPVLLSATGGVALLLWRRSRPALVLLVFAMVYFVFFNQFPSFFLRNMVPLIPVLAVLGAVFIEFLLVKAGGLFNKGALVVACLVLPTLLVPSLYRSFVEDRYMSQKDTRTMATEWIEAAVAQGGRVAAELHPLQWVGVDHVLDDGQPLNSRKLEWYADHGYSYLVMSSQAHPDDRNAIKNYPKGLEQVAAFPGDDYGGMGPDIFIYATGAKPDDLKMQQRIEAAFGTQIELVGYDAGELASLGGRVKQAAKTAEPVSVTRGKVLGLNLYWLALQDPEKDWTVFAHLVTAEGGKIAQRDTFPQDWNTLSLTSSWKKGMIVSGSFNIPVPADAPPGVYELEIGLYSASTGERLSITAPAGMTGDSLLLFKVQVK